MQIDGDEDEVVVEIDDEDGGEDDDLQVSGAAAGQQAGAEGEEGEGEEEAYLEEEGDEDLSGRVRKRIGKEVGRRHQAERRAEAAERRAVELEGRLNQNAEVVSEIATRMERLEGRTVEQEEEEAERQIAQLEEAKREAIEAGESAAQVKIDRDMAEARQRSDNIKAIKVRLDENRRVQHDRRTARPAAPEAPPKLAQDWKKANDDWYGKDRVMTAAAHAIDRDLAARGMNMEDPDYYRELDTQLRAELPDRFKKSRKPLRPRGNGGGAVEPVRRSGRGAGRRTLRITKTDQRVMEDLGMNPRDPKTVQAYLQEKKVAERDQAQ